MSLGVLDNGLVEGTSAPPSLLRAVPETEAEEPQSRIENWIVKTIGAEDEPSAESEWADLIGRITPSRALLKSRAASADKRRRDGRSGWPHFELCRRRGITVVVLSDRSLLKEHDLCELTGDLLALVTAGHDRIVLNFSAVERLSSWVVGAVADVVRRCAKAQGGALKVCSLRPELAQVFAITGLAREVSLYPDETAAIDSPWPEAPLLRPLPVDVLKALTETAGVTRPSTEKAPDERDAVDDGGTSPGFESEPSEMAGLWLVFQSGKAAGQAIAVDGSGLIIGRDASCQIRPGSANVSRLHAAIDRSGMRMRVRDLGSTNGTIHNGRLLRSEWALLAHGDVIQVGPVVLRVVVGPSRAVPEGVEDLVADWVKDETSDGSALDDDPPTCDELAIPSGIDTDQPVRTQLIEDVIVVTPHQDALSDRATTEALRAELVALLQGTTPRKVVIDLAHVGQINGRAIGIIVAFHMRIEQSGGTLRICQANPRVAAMLDQVQLPLLVDYHTSLEDAVLTAWPEAAVG